MFGPKTPIHIKKTQTVELSPDKNFVRKNKIKIKAQAENFTANRRS